MSAPIGDLALKCYKLLDKRLVYIQESFLFSDREAVTSELILLKRGECQKKGHPVWEAWRLLRLQEQRKIQNGT